MLISWCGGFHAGYADECSFFILEMYTGLFRGDGASCLQLTLKEVRKKLIGIYTGCI